MKNLDDELRNALRREEPPEGFVERVIARAGEARSRPGLIRPAVRWLAAAAVMLAVLGAGIQYRTAQIERARAEQAAGEAAGQRVMLALQITGSKLHIVQSRINRLHEQSDRNASQ